MAINCSSNFRSEHSTVLVLCLLRKLLEQSLLLAEQADTNIWVKLNLLLHYIPKVALKARTFLIAPP